MGIELGTRRNNEAKEREGVWVNIADTPSGYLWWLDGEPRPVSEKAQVARLKVARAGNTNAREYRKKALRPYQRVIRQLGDIPEEIARRVLFETIAETILLDWDGIDADGKPVSYSTEKALEFVAADEEFRLLVLDIAGTTQIYRDEEIAEAAETLGNASGGS